MRDSPAKTDDWNCRKLASASSTYRPTSVMSQEIRRISNTAAGSGQPMRDSQPECRHRLRRPTIQTTTQLALNSTTINTAGPAALPKPAKID